VINDRKGQTSITQLYAEVVFAKKTIPSSRKFFDDSEKSHLTLSTNYLKKKRQERLNAQLSFPVKLCTKCKDCLLFAERDNTAPCSPVKQGGIKEQ